MAETLPNSPARSLHRLRLIAGQTLHETLRLRLAWLLVATGVMLVGMAQGLRDFNFGVSELKFIADFGLGAIGLMGTLLAALATAHLFFNELAHGGSGCVLTRPVRRWEYLGGKLAGVMALLALFVGAWVGVLAIVLAVRGSQLGAAFFPLPVFLQAGAVLWLKFTLVAAMTLFVCSYAGSALFASSAGLLLAVVAHLRPLIEPAGWLAFLRAWPNLALFDAGFLLSGDGLPAGTLAGLAGYWASFVVLFVGLASHVFQRREF